MKIAIMQPYVFPYIGYFQLIHAADVFVFYDDVNFIKKGWINRNRILVNNEASLFTVPLAKVSQNRLINETQLACDKKWLDQFLSTLTMSYKKAPFFKETLDLAEDVFLSPHATIAQLAEDSIRKTVSYLQLPVEFEKSSEKYTVTKGMEKADRLIEITKLRNTQTYINPAGGKELYAKAYFKEKGIDLLFIENNIVSYKQYKEPFVGGLSMIDVLMFNSKEQIIEMLKAYQLN